MKTVILFASSSWYLYNFQRELIKELVKTGINVVTLAEDKQFCAELLDLGSKHFTICLKGKSKDIIGNVKVIWQLKTFFQKFDAIILSFTPKPNILGGIAAYLASRHCILNYSGFGRGINTTFFYGFIIRALYAITPYLANHCFVQNRESLLAIQKFAISKSKISLLPGSGVSLQRYKYIPVDTRSRVIRFGLFARMIKQKGIMTFIDAVKYLHAEESGKFEGVLAGPIDTSDQDAVDVQKMASSGQLGPIHYLGNLSDIRDEMMKCDVIVLPSNYPEGTPKVLLEALALGKVIITTNTPGCEATCSNNNGFLMKSHDPFELLACMRSALNLSATEYIEMSKNSRELAVREYDVRYIFSEYKGKIREFLESQK